MFIEGGGHDRFGMSMRMSFIALKRALAICALVVFSCVGLLETGQAFAQAQMLLSAASEKSASEGQVNLPEDLTSENIRQLVATMSDEQVRQLLLKRLDAVAKAEEAKKANKSQTFVELMTVSVTSLGKSFVGAVAGLPTMASGLAAAVETFVEPRGVSGVLLMLATILIAIGIGLAVETLVTRFAGKWRAQVEQTNIPDGLKETLELLVKRFLIDIAGLLAFFAVTRVMIHVLMPVIDRPLAPVFMVNLVVIPRFFAAVSRFLLAPRRPELRLVYTDDWTARFLHRNSIGIVLLVGFSTALLEFQRIHGVSLSEAKIGFWLSLAAHAWLAVMCVRARKGLTSMILGSDGDTTRVEQFLAKAYPWLAVGLIALTWLLVEILLTNGRYDLVSKGQQFITLGALLAAPVLDTMVRALVRHLVPPMRGEGPAAEMAYLSTKHSYIRIGRTIVVAGTIILIARLWNVDVESLASAGLGARIAAVLFQNLVILAIGYLVWELSTLWFNRKLADERTAAGFDLNAEEPGGGEGGGVGGSRLSTVLPLLKMASQVTIITITSLIVLGSLGVDITPLLAGAGIVGLAIGFGAQTLVRDIVSGLFFLLDDAFRVGEYLEIGDTVGTVERISIRSLQLRHHQGPVHTIPYGEIPKVQNNSRDWVIVKLKFTVPFEADINLVKKLFKQIGKEILEAPYADDIIQTFKSQGVYDVNDVGIVVRGKFMAKPGKQWMIKKDVYSRVQKYFAENGIEFARREVRVKMPESEEGHAGDDKMSSAAAASQIAVQQQIDEQTGGGGNR